MTEVKRMSVMEKVRNAKFKIGQVVKHRSFWATRGSIEDQQLQGDN
jgi:heat shock protein HspQ